MSRPGYTITCAQNAEGALLATVVGAAYAELGLEFDGTTEQRLLSDISGTFRTRGGEVWALTGNGATCGCLSVIPDQRGGARLVHLALAPAWRRLGLGRLLLEEARSWLREQSLSPLWIVLPGEATLARRCLLGCGFHELTPPAEVQVPQDGYYLQRA